MSPTPNRLLLLIALIGVGGCGTPGGARETASLLAAYTREVKAETERFAGSRTAIARARQAKLNELERSALSAENRNCYEVFLWGLESSKLRRSLFTLLIDETTDTQERLGELREMQQRHAASIDAAETQFDARSRDLAETARALSRLGAERELSEDLRYYAGFFGSVRRSIQEARDAAAAEAKAGSTAAESTVVEE